MLFSVEGYENKSGLQEAVSWLIEEKMCIRRLFWSFEPQTAIFGSEKRPKTKAFSSLQDRMVIFGLKTGMQSFPVPKLQFVRLKRFLIGASQWNRRSRQCSRGIGQRHSSLQRKQGFLAHAPNNESWAYDPFCIFLLAWKFH